MNVLEVKPASTVVLFERDHSWPTKTLLLKRSPNSKFLPGAHVFPGGQVDKEDYKQRSIADNIPLLDRTKRYFQLDQHQIIGHLAAAVRETKEETGISLDPDDLMPLSWWVTPKGETRRFNTWFFLAPVGQAAFSRPIPETREAEAPLLISPALALERYKEGEIFLAPPTRSILERMALARSAEEFISFIDQPLKAIHPLFITEGEQKILILPGHARHPDQERSAFILNTSYSFP